MEQAQDGAQRQQSYPTTNAERQARFVKRQQDQGRRPRRIWLTDGEYSVLKRRLGDQGAGEEGQAPGTSLFPSCGRDRLKTGGAHGLLDVMAAFAHPPDPIDYVLPNMVAGSVGALVSPGGTGKSMLALQLAAQIAGGPELLDLGTLPTGSVVYLPAEDPPIALQHRLHALGKHLSNEHRAVIAQNLLIQPLVGTGPDLLDREWFSSLLRIAWDRRLIILDTLRRFHREEENSSGSMSQVIGRMEAITAETGCSILFLHHVNKGSALAGSVGHQQSSRGSSVLTDNVRWQGHLSSMTDEEAAKRSVATEQRSLFVKFGVSKANYGRPFEDRWYKRLSGGILTPDNPGKQDSIHGASRAYD